MEKRSILPSGFYNRSTLRVAQELLGCFLVRKVKGKIIRAKITETEAYNGPKDLASHASRGKTERNKIMFAEPGTIYVYFTYGMHYMFNIVTEAKDYPAAVLIRAVELDDKKINTNGPARLTKFLQIDKSFNGLSVCTKKHGLWVEGKKEMISPRQIKKAKRVGVDYAGEYKDKLWRFILDE
jgi:DNA-3-methyladenine glycosylase